MEVKTYKFNARKLILNNKFIFVILFISILLYSYLYSNAVTPLDNLLNIAMDSVTIDLLSKIVNALKSTYVQLAINITTIIFSIYIMSLLLFLIAKIDILISKTGEEIYYFEMVDAYFKSLYVIICDFLFKSFYIFCMRSYGMSNLTIAYGFLINLVQCFMIFRFLKHKKNSFILTKIIYMIAIIALFVFQLIVLV